MDQCGADYFIGVDDPLTCVPCNTQCVQCHGPSISDCAKCKYYTVYNDLGIGEEDDEDAGGDTEALTVSSDCSCCCCCM